MHALISDLHSNIEAMTAIREDMSDHDVDRIYCLGDVIGYGPDPRPVIEMVRDCEVILTEGGPARTGDIG